MMTGVAVLSLAGLLASDAVGQGKGAPIQTLHTYKGRVSAEQQKQVMGKDRMAVIASEKKLAALWNAWKLEKQPKIDFGKELVIVYTSNTSGLKMSLLLKDGGNLQVLAIATRDIREDFAYDIQVIPREGIKTVEGKEIPKE
jgi:hypothetical protein